MRTPNSAWDAALDLLEDDAQVLVKIEKGGTVLHRLAIGWDADLTYAGQTYAAEPGASYQRLVASDRDQVAALRVEDPSNVWAGRLAATDYRHAKLSATLLSRSTIATADAAIGERMWIRDWNFAAEDLAFTFRLGLIVSLNGVTLPIRTYSDYYGFKNRAARLLLVAG